MGDKDDDWRIEDVLTHSAWIRNLARRLVADAADLDDVLQDAWIQAIRHGARAQSVRPWLATVLRNVVRSSRRSDARRRTRELTMEEGSAPTTPEQMVMRVEVERELATALLELAEPYRSTLLWRFFEDLSAADIARRSGVPAGTVRWRIKNGLQLLRDQLDARSKGDRRGWAIALMPSAAAARGGLAKAQFALIRGVVIAKSMWAAATALSLLLVAGGVGLWRHSSRPTAQVSEVQRRVSWHLDGQIDGVHTAPSTPTTTIVTVLPSTPRRVSPRTQRHAHFEHAAMPTRAVALPDSEWGRPAEIGYLEGVTGDAPNNGGHDPGGGAAPSVAAPDLTPTSRGAARPPSLDRSTCIENVDYPWRAAAVDKEGTVHLRVTLDSNGRVRDAAVLRGAGWGFDETAERAVKENCRFTPAYDAEGRRVPYVIQDYQFRFRLSEFATQGHESGGVTHFHFGRSRHALAAVAPPP
jgi:RNA polymerase sigma-70 factor (ECF subfamily)